MKLFPTFELPNIIDESSDVKTEYKESIYFDGTDIVLDGAGKVKIADGRDAWLQWCVKMIYSERYTLLSYPSGIGVEMERIAGIPDRESKKIAIENTIKDTLMKDPAHRTVEVSNFRYTYGVDTIGITFDLVGADGYVGSITVEIEG